MINKIIHRLSCYPAFRAVKRSLLTMPVVNMSRQVWLRCQLERAYFAAVKTFFHFFVFQIISFSRLRSIFRIRYSFWRFSERRCLNRFSQAQGNTTYHQSDGKWLITISSRLHWSSQSSLTCESKLKSSEGIKQIFLLFFLFISSIRIHLLFPEWLLIWKMKTV